MSTSPAPWATARRPVGLALNATPPPRPALSVEEWESRSPLTSKETRSVHHLKKACESRSLPAKFAPEPPGPSTPPRAFKRDIVAERRSPSPSPLLRSNLHPLHPTHPIQTPQQFNDWFALIERSIQHSQEGHFRAYLSLVAGHLETCTDLITDVDTIESEVTDMHQGWRGVEEGGRSLKGASERLLEERDRLIQVTEGIATRLEYFQELERATRMLNHPGESLVLQTDFLHMVERVDVCLEFLQAHRQFREAEIYILRFQQCLTRAMTLIKMFFVGSLKAITADIQKRISEKDVSTTSQHHLLYAKFASISTQLGPLLAELERRALSHPGELDSLLAECHVAYFAARKSLLVTRLVEDIKGLDPSRSELVELTSSGCSYLKQLCSEEFVLYRKFFNSGQDKLYRYLENLCDYLYDDLRPRILHEPRLTVLCQVCTVIQALMALDIDVSAAVVPGDDDSELNSPQDSTLTPESLEAGMGLERLHISHLLQMILQDAQTRLFFKAQAMVQSDIRYYVPKDGDLDYPAKLSRKGEDTEETRYPTLQKATWVLGQLQDFVKAEIFQDIAQEAVILCRQSLSSASELMLVQRAEAPADAYLFLVRHLLILKDMVSTMELGKTDPRTVDLDYGIGGVTESLAGLLRGTSSLLTQTNIFASLGMPRAPEPTITDPKTDIDRELKQACEMLINLGANAATTSLTAFLTAAAPHIALSSTTASTSRPVLSAQPFATPSAVQAVHANFLSTAEREVKTWVTRLRLYLEDPKTVAILVGPLQARIVEQYAELRDVVQGHYGEEVIAMLLSHHALSKLVGTWAGVES